MMTKTHGFTQ